MTASLERATVIGAGAMGTLVSLLLAGRGTRVTLWARSADHVADLQADRRNNRYLPGHPLPDLITVTRDAAEALDGSRVKFSAGVLLRSFPKRRIRLNGLFESVA